MCQTEPCHYLNQCRLNISDVLWHSPEGNFTRNVQVIYPRYGFENYQFKITAASPRNTQHTHKNKTKQKKQPTELNALTRRQKPPAVPLLCSPQIQPRTETWKNSARATSAQWQTQWTTLDGEENQRSSLSCWRQSLLNHWSWEKS